METVLGLSLTAKNVGWILVDRNDTEGTALDHDSFDIVAATDADPSRQLAAVRGAQAIAASSGHQVHSIGVTWTDDVDATAAALLKALPECGFDNVVTVRPVVSEDTHLALARAAALAVATNAEADSGQPVRRRPRFTHVGAATALVAGAIAVFAIGPEFAGQQGTASTETRPAAESSASATSPISISSATPASARYVPPSPIAAPSPQQARPLVADPPQVPDEPEHVDTTVATGVVASPPTETPAAVPVAAAQEHLAVPPVVPQQPVTPPGAAQPTPPIPPPAPAPAPQDPVSAVLSPLFGALP